MISDAIGGRRGSIRVLENPGACREIPTSPPSFAAERQHRVRACRATRGHDRGDDHHEPPPDHRGHGGRPTVTVVPVGSVIGDVGVVAVNDVVEPLPPDVLTALAAPVIAPGVFVDTPDPVVMLVEPGDVVIDALPDPDEDALLLGVDMLELIDDERDDVGAVCVNSNAIPLLPSTDPVWTLTIGLQGVDGVLVSPGVWLGGVSEVGFCGTCATAVDAHAMLIQMNKESFISNLLFRSAVRFTGDSLQAASHTPARARLKGSRCRMSTSRIARVE